FVDRDGHVAQVLVGAGVGALFGLSTNLVRQALAIAEGSQDEFSWTQLGLSTITGAGLGALASVNPVLASQLALGSSAVGLGVGAYEVSQEGHRATGAFDMLVSVGGGIFTLNQLPGLSGQASEAAGVIAEGMRGAVMTKPAGPAPVAPRQGPSVPTRT